MKAIMTAAFVAVLASNVNAGGMTDPVVEPEVIIETASESSMSGAVVMAIMTISMLWAGITD